VHGQRVLAQELGLDPAGLPRDPAVSMQLVPLPAGLASTPDEAAALQSRIGDQIAVEVAVTSWDGQGFLRLSAQAYNSPADYARLAADLPALL
jgi:isopenicillin-N epimerase